MLAKARSRSSSDTPCTWSKRARAFLTCEASVTGSLRCLGKAYALSGSSSRSLDLSSPCSVYGFQVGLIDIVRYLPKYGGAVRAALLTSCTHANCVPGCDLKCRRKLTRGSGYCYVIKVARKTHVL